MARSTGIVKRHSRSCTSRQGKRCNCSPRFEAWVWSPRDNKKISKSFPTEAAAKSWRSDADTGIRRRTMRAPTSKTVQQAADEWLAGARDGSIRNRSGDVYKPSAIRGYETSLRLRVLDYLGTVKLSDVHRGNVQDLADRLLGEGLDPSTIRNTLMPLRAIYRRALGRGEVAVNPTAGVELPAVRGSRDRIADPTEAAKLLAAVPEDDRALWATAMYAGLRRGELMALRWEDINLATGIINVTRSWDMHEGAIEPKSRAAVRKVPIPAVLRDFLLPHKLLSGRSTGLVFGRSAIRPFEPVSVNARAAKAWTKAKLTAITLHEARHTFASLMIASGVNAKALSTYLGHASIQITFDRYGHLMPGNEDEAAALLDGYLERADTAARGAQIERGER